jgi:hypothetical protein
MAEEKPPSKIRGWIKAVLTSIMGLFSGAILMYVSPLVTGAIKPGKPVANFAEFAQGLTVTFQNRAAGASEGWWDFGDGSPLEPFSATQEAVTHTYPHTGSYNVKLSLRNFLGEENERVSPVILDGGANNTPHIESFKVDPIKPAPTAPGTLKTAMTPATFRVASQIKNTDLCIWSLGGPNPNIEVSNDNSPSQERLVTIKEPGFYTMRLVAVSGKQIDEKAESVVVIAGNSSAPSANLQVTYQAVHVQRTNKEANLHVAFPPDRKESSYPFTLTHMVEPDSQIIDAQFTKPGKETSVKNPTLTISKDKSKVVLTGELVKPAGITALKRNQPLPKWTPTVSLTVERRSEPVLKTLDPITIDVNLPGTTILPVPPLSSRWQIKGTMVHLELLDGATLVFKGSKLPIGTIVNFQNHPYRLTATQEPGHIRLDVIDSKVTFRPIGN